MRKRKETRERRQETRERKSKEKQERGEKKRKPRKETEGDTRESRPKERQERNKRKRNSRNETEGETRRQGRQERPGEATEGAARRRGPTAARAREHRTKPSLRAQTQDLFLTSDYLVISPFFTQVDCQKGRYSGGRWYQPCIKLSAGWLH